MGLNLELDRKLEVTWHSVILGILRECLQDLRMIFHKSTTLGGNSQCPAHSKCLICQLAPSWCVFISHRLNLMPARPQPLHSDMNDCSFPRNWGMRSMGFTYMESDYMQLVPGQELWLWQQWRYDRTHFDINVKKSFISYPISASVSYLVPYPQKHLLEQIGNIRWKGKWYRSQTQVTSGLIRSSAA